MTGRLHGEEGRWCAVCEQWVGGDVWDGHRGLHKPELDFADAMDLAAATLPPIDREVDAVIAQALARRRRFE